MTALGTLSKLSPQYNEDIKIIGGLQSNSEVSETVQEKRKRLFNKETGTLTLSFRGIPFWIWNETKHNKEYKRTKGYCCFNHIIGLPRDNKSGTENPLFPYQYELFAALFNPKYANPNNDYKRWKHVWVKKATGMGITEFMIRLMVYLPLAYPENYHNTQMAIVTGINMVTAKRIMKRMKNLFYDQFKIVFDTNDRVLDVNGCIIETYPAINPDTYRSLSNVKFIFCDEADFFPESIISDVLDAIERYFAKSNPFVIINSTPNKPGGLLEQIEKQDEDKCVYKRLFLLADKGLGYIYTEQDLELAKQSDSYPREYLGEYTGLKGNLFSKDVLDYAASLSDHLDVLDKQTGILKRSILRQPEELSLNEVISNYKFLGSAYPTSIGIDPAYNSSNFAFVVTKQIGNLIYVVREVELQGPTHEEAIETCKTLMYEEYPSYHPKLYVDASGVSFLRTLKKEIMEDTEYHNLKQDVLIKNILSMNGMIACPIPFQKWGDRMNYHLKRLFELGMIRISPDVTPYTFVSLQTASYDENKNRFNKKDTAKNDCFDGLRLATINYKIGNLGVLHI